MFSRECAASACFAFFADSAVMDFADLPPWRRYSSIDPAVLGLPSYSRVFETLTPDWF